MRQEGRTAPAGRTRLPGAVWRAAAFLFLSSGAETFFLFSLLWVAEPQGWSGPATAGLVLALRLPSLAGGVVFGSAVDKYGPRPVAVADTSVRTVLFAGLAVAGWHGVLPLPAVMLAGALGGALGPASYASVRAGLPRLVGAATLPRANTVVAAGEQLQLLAGAALVGPALQALGPGRAMLVPAGMLCLAAALARALPGGSAPASSPTSGGDAARPLAVVRVPRRVGALVALSTAYYFAYGPFEAVTPFYVRDQLGAQEGAYSVLWAAFACGALLTLPLAPLLAKSRPGAVNALGAVIWGAVMLPLAYVDGVAGAALVFLVGGAVWGPYSAVEATALHRWVAPEAHGRVFGIQRSLLATAAPLGAAAGAVAARHHDAATLLAASALACSAAGAAALARTDLRRP